MKKFIWAAVFVAGQLFGTASAQLQAIPPNVAPDPSLPMILLNVSKDFSMFSRVYTDYEDLDFDGVIDYTFKPDFKYYGYFDPTKCYTYSSAGFAPALTAIVESSKYYCVASGATSSTYWSGNFLNWATMSRMDVLRKILYGGLRSTDSTSQTILELSFVPANSQAFAKYYNGSDLIRLTPFNYSDGLTLCRRQAYSSSDTTLSQSSTLLPQIRAARGNYLLWNMTEVRTCNWDGDVSYTWKSLSRTYVDNNYVGAGGAATHKTSTPVKSTNGAAYSSLGPEFTARVEVCNASYLGEEKCKQYPNGGLKPIGLLNEFGESTNYGTLPARAEFGLMLGSFDNNLNGAILRKNLAEINDEIDSNTGQLLTASSSRGIIYSLNSLRVYGYKPSNGSYSENCYSYNLTNGSCPSWGNPIGEIVLEGMRYYAGKTAAQSSGTKDAEFGLPTPTRNDPLVATRTYSTGKTRVDLYGKNMCRPLNMVTISSGVSTFDDDGMSAISDLGAPNSAAYYTDQIGTQEGIASTTRLIGSNGTTNNELCTGKTMGGLGSAKGLCPEAPNMRGTFLSAGASYYARVNRIRSDLTLPSDANVDALKLKQYAISMSGGSTSIRIPVPNTNPQKYVYLTPASRDWNDGRSGGTAGNQVDFKVLKRAADGSSGTFLVLWQHAQLGEDQDQDMLQSIRYTTNSAVNPPTITIYTQTLESDTGSSSPYAGGYTLVGTNRDGLHLHTGINNYTVVESVTPSYSAGDVQSAPRDTTAKCYLNDDGSTPSGWDYTIASRLCVKIANAATSGGYDYVKGETSLTYNMLGSTDALIQDPLWYMAKYGGFNDSRTAPSGMPDATSKWDVKRADGAACSGASCSDGIPDNYFLARRPDLLEDALRQVFLAIVETSNSAPAVSRPDLRTGDYKYVAQFDPNDLRGELASYKILANGDFESSPTALGHKLMTDTLPSVRQVITNAGTVGIPFTYSAILGASSGAATYIANLGAGAVSPTTAATMATARIDYLRGSRTNERPAGLDFRARSLNSIMGGVVNSNPWLQDRPIANYFGSSYSGYGTFKTAQSTRARVLWVGAEDGMLHGFNSDTLAPILSYVPNPLSATVKNFTDASVTTVSALMDGSPFTADVITTASGWKTYLFSSLGRGGKGIFALDVTATASLTETNASNIFKWQFTNSDDADLGYVLSEGGIHPVTAQAGQIAKLPNGKFAVLYGNGVSSTNGKAVLYILFVDGPSSSGVWTAGTHYVKIVADSGSGNGLMQPAWLDSDGDGIADTIYAGDLQGNLWKFNVSSTTTSSWGVSYSGTPLYVAKDSANARLPITSVPIAQFHPQGGQVVAFGTGKSIVSGDFPQTGRTFRIFGIWDKPVYASSTSSIPSGLSELQTRTWAINSSNNLYQTSTTSIDWTTKKGWYMNIPYSSGMVISNPEYSKDGSKDIAIPLIYPADTANSCNGGSVGVYTQFNPITGLLSADIFGTGISSGNGVTVGITLSDQRFRLAEDSTARCGAGLNCQRIIGQTVDKTTSRNTTQSRIFWREIPGLRTSDD